MSTPADRVKHHAVARLDRDATIHPSNHQNVHARRYLLPKAVGPSAEVLIVIKGDQLQLWCEAGPIDRMIGASLGGTFRPGNETYATTNTRGELLYGRHSALKTMDRLIRGDAWRFVPQTVADVDRILDAIAA